MTLLCFGSKSLIAARGVYKLNSQPNSHIFIIDDIGANRKLFNHHLKRAGYRDETASGGTEALKKSVVNYLILYYWI
jgi:ActR/RegA family two-component response regulator